MNRAVRLSIGIACASVLGACSNLMTADQPAAQVYWLEPVTRLHDDRVTNPRPGIRVTVKAVPGLDTDRILVKGPGPRLNYYGNARWPDHLPEVIESLVRLSLDSTGQFSRVTGRVTAAPRARVLELEVREFFAVTESADDPPTIHFEIAGYLDCGSEYEAVGSKATAKLARNRLGDIVAGFQQVTDEVLNALVDQISENCKR